MKATTLINEIESEFPEVEMPEGLALSFHKDDFFECEYLRNDLEEYRGKEISGEVIRLLHQELSCLSADGWLWILRHYLKFCLTPEAEYNQMETEFLIYNLGPDEKFEEETLQRLSGLNQAQLNCIVHFLEWCAEHPFWKEYFPESIAKALSFVKSIKAHN
jgi:hypothetical protein